MKFSEKDFHTLEIVTLTFMEVFLIHISQKYNLVGNKHCITDLIDTGSNQTIELCTICSVDVFRKAEILHIFKLEW